MREIRFSLTEKGDRNGATELGGRLSLLNRSNSRGVERKGKKGGGKTRRKVPDSLDYAKIKKEIAEESGGSARSAYSIYLPGTRGREDQEEGDLKKGLLQQSELNTMDDAHAHRNHGRRGGKNSKKKTLRPR